MCQKLFTVWFYGVYLSLQVKHWLCMWTTKSLFLIVNWVVHSRSDAAESRSRPPPDVCTWLRARAAVTSCCPANFYCSCYCFVGPGMSWIIQRFLKVYLRVYNVSLSLSSLSSLDDCCKVWGSNLKEITFSFDITPLLISAVLYKSDFLTYMQDTNRCIHSHSKHGCHWELFASPRIEDQIWGQEGPKHKHRQSL